MATILVIPDIQVPFHHADSIRFLELVKRTHNPDIVVQIGDLADQHHFSKYSNSTKGSGGRQEFEDAASSLAPLYKLFPKVYFCWGNHDLRIFQKASEAGIDSSFLKDYKEMLNMPKQWELADRWVFEDIIFEHGIGRSGSQGALKAAMANMQSTVIGHLHSHAGILYHANKKALIFGFNVGALVDDRKYAFEYGRFSASKSVLGCGLIIDGVPVFIPMVIDKNHKWNEKI